MSGPEQATDQQHILQCHGPHHFTLVDGSHVVDLHTYVARRVRSIEGVEHDVAGLEHFGRCGTGAHAHVHLAFGELRQGVESGLQIIAVVAHHEVEVRGHGRAVEGAHKDGLRFL